MIWRGSPDCSFPYLAEKFRKLSRIFEILSDTAAKVS